jgi:hypothetical protein
MASVYTILKFHDPGIQYERPGNVHGIEDGGALGNPEIVLAHRSRSAKAGQLH